MALVAAQVTADAVPVTTHQQPPTYAQLHELACIRCGSEASELEPAGHHFTLTGEATASLGWPVVACTSGCLQEEQ
ncbi:hypothetical protein GCM10018790_75320 [Kitasatospora xanthocidica]|nr:hypothetical protein GCM10018790_75320 [Kitasatospora xanthocidica]